MTKAIAAAAAAVLALAGCAALNVMDTEVSSFSRWPGRPRPATYAFERLPSQQANPQAAEVLEDSARRAVEAAGFVPAAEGTVPDVSVQIGRGSPPPTARPTTTRSGTAPTAGVRTIGPFYGRHGRGYWGPGWGPYWGPYGRYGAWGPWYYDFPTTSARSRS